MPSVVSRSRSRRDVRLVSRMFVDGNGELCRKDMSKAQILTIVNRAPVVVTSIHLLPQ
jgi:hypothetical protein